MDKHPSELHQQFIILAHQAGNDIYNLSGVSVQHFNFYNFNGNDTIQGFAKGTDKFHFLDPNMSGRVSVVASGSDSIITIVNPGTGTGSSTITVKGVNNINSSDWQFT